MKLELPESRLPSLYRDFRPLKDLNPDGYDANINTWKEYLRERYLSCSGKVTFAIGTRLLQELTHEVYGVPKSIDMVIDALVSEGDLVPMEVFHRGGLYSDNNKLGFWRWIRNWKGSTNTYRSRRDESNFYLKEDEFVIKTRLEKEYQRFHDLLKNSVFTKASTITDLVFTVNDFVTEESIGPFFETYNEMAKKVFLFFLENYKHVIISKDNVVKIIAPEVEDVISRFSTDVTENDVRIATVKVGILNISKQITRLRKEIDKSGARLNDPEFNDLPNKIRIEYKQTRLLSERHLSKLLKFQNNLAEVRSQIDTSLTNAMLFQTLSESNEVIKSINGYIGSTEKVEDLLEEIKEGHDRTEEINDLLTNYKTGQDNEEDEEIERELERLQIDEMNKNRENDSNRNADESKESSNEDLLDRLNSLKIDTSEEPVKNDTSQDKERRKVMVEELH
ncbi:hypothetical protein SEUBUCD646_0J01590 [Saccharomyces eubayanus]|uniref:Uncharacterized protein n=2 Tax=Saccharomyces TaxID=4930 RepID=A0A6C1EAA9_SACPS|nr:hypothetical protein GRS66_008668 [Saccharomyces pastorianus]CAI1512155.1 hypothetical protein SEUBUCD650_0J01600 [Saccharomyces eubayanus]CAI1528247.1 hypothetical protein SEUBUCD646_0J01590 [Saccharomyces eubayanus]